MGEVVSKFWEQGVGEVPQDLRPLQGWTREKLVSAVERFKAQDRLSIRLAGFWRILNLPDKDAAIAAWTALGLKEDACVDFLSVILPMVAMSKQEFISRVTLTFSICDFNSNGSIKRSEFFIGLRSLFKGLSRFFPKSRPPSNDELEAAVEIVFKSMDLDKSGELELEEILTFGYRSKGTRALLSPFPVSDTRVFESLVYFAGMDEIRQRTRQEQLTKVESEMKSKLMLTPDPVFTTGSKQKRQRPWKEPAVVTRPKAFLLWSVFSKLQKNCTISSEDLRTFLSNRLLVTEVLDQAFDRLLQLSGTNGIDCEKDQRVKIIEKLKSHFEHPDFLAKVKQYEDGGGISFRCLASLLWPTVPAKDITACVKWARQFQAFHMLQELTKRKESALTNSEFDESDGVKFDLSKDDVEALFEVLDVNSDGKLTPQELVAGGLKLEQANQLMQLWDRDRSNELDKGEIMSIVWGMNQVVRGQMKGLFAASVLTGPTAPQH